jgi:hypothetical protein
MSQSEDIKKDLLNENSEHEEKPFPVGELKWKKEQEKEPLEENQEATEEAQQKGNNNPQKEVSATLLDLEEQEEKTDQKEVLTNTKEEEPSVDKKQDPLAGIEDTLTPIDFKTYEFDANQLRAIEEEMKASQQIELETNAHAKGIEDPVGAEIEEAEEYKSDSKWAKRSIWILGLPAVLVVVFLVSLMVGHSVVGGQPAGDVFDIDMWIHVYTLIYG